MGVSCPLISILGIVGFHFDQLRSNPLSRQNEMNTSNVTCFIPFNFVGIGFRHVLLGAISDINQKWEDDSGCVFYSNRWAPHRARKLWHQCRVDYRKLSADQRTRIVPKRESMPPKPQSTTIRVWGGGGWSHRPAGPHTAPIHSHGVGHELFT